MSIPAFLLGLLPFVNLFRAFPIPALWTELAALSAFGLWLVTSMERRVDVPVKVNPLQAAVALVLLAVAVRSGSGGALSGLICCLALLCALAIHASGFSFVRQECEQSVARVLDGWAYGVAAALLLNVGASVLAWHELEVVLYTLVPAKTPERMGGTFGQPNQFGVFAALAIAAIIHLQSRRKMPTYAAFFGVAVAVVAIAMTGSRSALLVWALVWATTRRQGATPRCASAMFHWQWSAMMFAQMFWLYHSSAGSVAATSGEVASVLTRPSGTPRLEQWRDAWQLILMHPLLGVGWGQFAEARFFLLTGSMSEPEAAHTHNLFSNLIVELGVFGWLASGLLIWHGWRLCRSALTPEGERLLPAVCALVLMAYAMFEYPFWSVNFLFSFVWLSALATPDSPGRQASLSGWGFRAMGGIMILSAAWLALDYANFQRRLMQVDVFMRGATPHEVSEVEVLEVRRQTMFVNAVDEYWIDTSSRLDGAGAMKWPIVERLFSSTPTVGGGIKYVMYAIVAEQPDKAAAVLDRFRTSAPAYMFPLMMKVLSREAKQDPALDNFLKAYVQGIDGRKRDAPEPIDGGSGKPGPR